MTPNEFIAKWRGGGDERRDAQSFFDDLCRLVEHKTPREADPDHLWFTYEYGVGKAVGGKGFADAWKMDYFGWEAKGTGRSLQDAYAQLKMYADDLQNPPLLVVSDLQTIEIHTNFTNTVKEVHRFTVEDLANPDVLRKVRAMFHNPEELRPGILRSDITAEAAERFAELAWVLRERGHPPQQVAHFLNRLVFCMFAEDIGLLPRQLFTRMVEGSQDDADAFEANAAQLFRAMREGGQAGFTRVDWFNGGLFDNDDTLRLERQDLRILLAACRLKWDQIDPSIFGTLFERGLDPAKRAQLGAHYTDPGTIEKLIRPVIVEPWLAAWEEEKRALTPLLEKADTRGSRQGQSAAQKGARTKAFDHAQARFTRFLERLRAFTVLDPACGSGNFLFMSLRVLKDLEQRVMIEAEELGLQRQILGVNPRQVLGIELNEYAAELARITVWIGELQWMIQNGYGARKNPILLPLDQIQCRDALLNADGTEATWPAVDAIVGNPPFIGNKKIVGELGGAYASAVRKVFKGRLPGGVDFVCYWFEKALASILAGTTHRAGLVSTSSIRNGASREALRQVVDNSTIFDAWDDLEWWDKGAAVRVSLACFGSGFRGVHLNGDPVDGITANLTATSGVDITKAKILDENLHVAFQGVIPRGEVNAKRKAELHLPDASFVLNGAEARRLLSQPTTVRKEPIAQVVRPYVIADDLAGRPLDRYVVNFGDRDEVDASRFEGPFAAIQNVRFHRQHMGGKDARTWWLLARSRPAMYRNMASVSHYIATPRVSKHRLFVRLDASVVPDSRLFAIIRDDMTTLGILHSRVHEVWSLATSSRHGVGNDPTYNAESCFETFPFPEGLTPNLPAKDYAEDPRAEQIARAAHKLLRDRDHWLNPPELVTWERTSAEVAAGFPARPVPRSGEEDALRARTLTNLYNERPAWLASLHDDLDRAVAVAYGWEWPLDDEEILRRLFELNARRHSGVNKVADEE